ncbi:MAG: hypothetical protein ACRDZ5_01475 [Acidimicrobiales bacterium]
MGYRAVQEPIPSDRQSPTSALQAFNPLLRSLVSWDLVSRVTNPDGSYTWELSEAAQRRLEELTPARRRETSSLAYLDHTCASCRSQRLTHLREGRYVCPECEKIETQQASDSPAPERPNHRHLLHRS